MKFGDSQSDDLPTRDAIARLILEHGPATASTLSQALALTPAGIRRHLDLLVADGILEARDLETPRYAVEDAHQKSFS